MKEIIKKLGVTEVNTLMELVRMRAMKDEDANAGAMHEESRMGLHYEVSSTPGMRSSPAASSTCITRV